jgi:hypothetical protein
MLPKTRTNIGIIFNSTKPYNEFKELLLPSLLSQDLNVVNIFTFQNKIQDLEKRFIDIKSRLIKKFHIIYHLAIIWKLRDSSISYKFRALNELGTNRERAKNLNNFHVYNCNRSWIEKFIIRLFARKILLKLLKKVLEHLFFYYLSIKHKLILDKIKILIIPYGARLSLEEDFLIWFAKKQKIKTISIQENWDNLSSKKFIYGETDLFLTWGKQSSQHLRDIQNYKAKIIEIGCIRMQQFYNYFDTRLVTTKTQSKSKVDSRLKNVLVIGNGSLNDIDLYRYLSEMDIPQLFSQSKGLNFVFRPHPFSRLDMNKSFSSKHNKYLKIDIPESNEKNIYRMKLIARADLVVGFYSTVLLEALIMGKVVAIPSFLWRDLSYKPEDYLNDSAHYQGLRNSPNVYNFSSKFNFEQFINDLPMPVSNLNSRLIVEACCANQDTVKSITRIINELVTSG